MRYHLLPDNVADSLDEPAKILCKQKYQWGPFLDHTEVGPMEESTKILVGRRIGLWCIPLISIIAVFQGSRVRRPQWASSRYTLSVLPAHTHTHLAGGSGRNASRGSLIGSRRAMSAIAIFAARLFLATRKKCTVNLAQVAKLVGAGWGARGASGVLRKPVHGAGHKVRPSAGRRCSVAGRKNSLGTGSLGRRQGWRITLHSSASISPRNIRTRSSFPSKRDETHCLHNASTWNINSLLQYGLVLYGNSSYHNNALSKWLFQIETSATGFYQTKTVKHIEAHFLDFSLLVCKHSNGNFSSLQEDDNSISLTFEKDNSKCS